MSLFSTHLHRHPSTKTRVPPPPAAGDPRHHHRHAECGEGGSVAVGGGEVWGTAQVGVGPTVEPSVTRVSNYRERNEAINTCETKSTCFERVPPVRQALDISH